MVDTKTLRSFLQFIKPVLVGGRGKIAGFLLLFLAVEKN